MPRWRALCKDGEEPTGFYETKAFEKEFNIKSGFGPVKLDQYGHEVLNCDLQPVLQYNRCWSCVPKEWAPAIHELLGKIRAKYRVETLDDDENDPKIQVWVDQIKDKFGSLRFYYSAICNEFYDDIDKMVEECEERLAKDDPYYNVPY